MKYIYVFVVLVALVALTVEGNKRDVSGGGPIRRKKVKTNQDDARRRPAHYTDRDRLVDELMQPYNTLVPGATQNKIEFGISLNTIIQLDTSNQVLITRATLHSKWNDERLTWNASNNYGINKLALPIYRIWKPQIILLNSADDGFDGALPVPAIVNEKGIVQYNPIGIFRSSCPIVLREVDEIPAETQTCTLKFGLAYNEEVENISLVWEPNLSTTINFEQNSIWEIVNVTTTKTKNAYSGHDVALEGLHLNLKLHRRGA